MQVVTSTINHRIQPLVLATIGYAIDWGPHPEAPGFSHCLSTRCLRETLPVVTIRYQNFGEYLKGFYGPTVPNTAAVAAAELNDPGAWSWSQYKAAECGS